MLFRSRLSLHLLLVESFAKWEVHNHCKEADDTAEGSDESPEIDVEFGEDGEDGTEESWEGDEEP